MRLQCRSPFLGQSLSMVVISPSMVDPGNLIIKKEIGYSMETSVRQLGVLRSKCKKKRPNLQLNATLHLNFSSPWDPFYRCPVEISSPSPYL